MTSSCLACGAPATTSWQRYATTSEIRRWIADPKVPSVRVGDTEALVPVLACDVHSFPPVMDDGGVERPSDLSARIHDAECQAPPTCTCSIAR